MVVYLYSKRSEQIMFTLPIYIFGLIHLILKRGKNKVIFILSITTILIILLGSVLSFSRFVLPPVELDI